MKRQAHGLRSGLAVVAAMAILATACGGGGQASTPDLCPAPRAGVTVHAGIGGSMWNDVLISSSGLWVAGHDGAAAGNSVEPLGNTRAVLARLAADGSLAWHSNDIFETGGTDTLEALTLGENGSVLAIGRTTGAFPGQINAGKTDIFVGRADPATAFRKWTVGQFGNERPQRPRRAAMQGLTGLVVAGYDDEYVPTNYVESWSDPFVSGVRLAERPDGSGSVQTLWHHQFETVEPDFLDGLGIAHDGQSVLVSGQFGGGGDTRGMFVRRLDSQGRALWTARYSSVALDHVAAVIPLADGTAWIAGSVYGSFRGAPSLGQQDVFVARIDGADGRPLASWQFGTPEADWLTDLRTDKDGNLLLFGETLGSFLDNRGPTNGIDLFLLKISSAGKLLAVTQWGGPQDEAAGRLAVDACGNAIAVGSTVSGGYRHSLVWSWPAREQR